MYCRINTISWKSCIKLKVLAVLNCPVVCVCLVKKTGPNFPIQSSLHCNLDPAVFCLKNALGQQGQARTSKGKHGQAKKKCTKWMKINKKGWKWMKNLIFKNFLKIQFALDIKIPDDIKHSACHYITRVFINRKRIFVWWKHQQKLIHFSDLYKDFAMILSMRTMMLLMKMVMLLVKMVMLLVKMVGAGMLSLTRSANFHHKQRRWKPNSACPIYQQTVGGEVGRGGGGSL